MNEEQTKHDKITPALKEAGWDRAPFKLALEQQVAPGRVEHDGRSHKPERADYVLMCGNRRLAVVEFMHFPTPQELLDLLKLTDDESPLEKACREVPFLPTARYYQERAVEGVIRALGRGQKNALITLATGTGKTFIAYQLVKKLVAAKWCRQKGETVIGLRKPRVLFLADRNILADQAKESFKFASPNECYRLEAGTDDPPMDRTVYFTLYQTLLGTGTGEGVGEGVGVGGGVGVGEELEVKFKKFPEWARDCRVLAGQDLLRQRDADGGGLPDPFCDGRSEGDADSQTPACVLGRHGQAQGLH